VLSAQCKQISCIGWGLTALLTQIRSYRACNSKSVKLQSPTDTKLSFIVWSLFSNLAIYHQHLRVNSQVNLGQPVTLGFHPPLVLEQNLQEKWHEHVLWTGCPCCQSTNTVKAQEINDPNQWPVLIHQWTDPRGRAAASCTPALWRPLPHFSV